MLRVRAQWERVVPRSLSRPLLGVRLELATFESPALDAFVDLVRKIAEASSLAVRLCDEDERPVIIRHSTAGLTAAPATLETECSL
ncbi:MAG: hypothetical protein ISN28_09505 [Ectothiorhodospiraceae bacterium AqS1]|nr:hypothetical protein [Ectothiorhodospiraceae bacterium AqS1]